MLVAVMVPLNVAIKLSMWNMYHKNCYDYSEIND